MNILITGAKGQLGNELRKISDNRQRYCYFFTDVDELDITDEAAIDVFMSRHGINTVINCAAYTAVDKAESDEPAAMLINGAAVAFLANACNKMNAALIHISTDYVFDGCACIPYKEEHCTNPATAYGRSKLAGEQAALTAKKSLIIRTSWLYSSFGNNFVKTMLNLGKKQETVRVVSDQTGTPTYAGDLAKMIMKIVDKLTENDLMFGIFNYSNDGCCSWYDFAVEIMQQANLKCTVQAIESKDYPTPAQRPHYSVLNKERIKNCLDIEIPHWKDSLRRCIAEL